MPPPSVWGGRENGTDNGARGLPFDKIISFSNMRRVLASPRVASSCSCVVFPRLIFRNATSQVGFQSGRVIPPNALSLILHQRLPPECSKPMTVFVSSHRRREFCRHSCYGRTMISPYIPNG